LLGSDNVVQLMEKLCGF